MSTNLTQEQAYKAMFSFLETYYAATGADDVGALLGSMNLLGDGKPADPGIWADWCHAVDKVLLGH